ncbi:MAG: hypothetical protein Q8L69_03970 [Gallionellaceae bacterium]|nr:hypothetical protein [Gallionellaceae bacterium]
MEINNATAASLSALTSSPQPEAPAARVEKQSEQGQESTVVSLSEQATQLNRAETQNKDAERAETTPQEAAEPQGIQFIATENKGGRIDTYA